VSEALVSVILPVYNGAGFLREAIASVLDQDYPEKELIVIDDGSSDGSADIAAAISGVQLIRRANAGVAAARNVALAASRGAYIAFIDHDDQWLPGKLTKQVGFLNAHPEMAYVVAREKLVLDEGTALPQWARPEALTQDLVAYIPSVLVARRWAFDRVGHFDESYVNGSDTDWFYRVKDAGFPSGVVDETLLLRRAHGANASNQWHISRGDLFKALHASMNRRRKGNEA